MIILKYSVLIPDQCDDNNTLNVFLFDTCIDSITQNIEVVLNYENVNDETMYKVLKFMFVKREGKRST